MDAQAHFFRRPPSGFVLQPGSAGSAQGPGPLAVRRLRAYTVGLLLALGAGAAMAQAWPTKPITMIVPFPPGGVADTVARPVAEALGKALGQTVVVENRAGAGGATGIGAAARAPADGYTVLLSLSSISILPEADKILNRKPAFTLKDFKPVARFTADPTVLVVRAESPWKSLPEFIAYAKAHPGKLNFGSSGNYGTMHVPVEMLKAKAGIFMTHIPYTGAGPAVLALLGGQVDAIASGPSTVAGHIKAGKMRALAHWGDKPLQSLPAVPSLKQAGYPVGFAQWSALFVPAGVPDDIVARLRTAARAAAQDPQVVAIINKAGSPIEYLDAPEFQAYWDADAAIMTEAVRGIGKVE